MGNNPIGIIGWLMIAAPFFIVGLVAVIIGRRPYHQPKDASPATQFGKLGPENPYRASGALRPAPNQVWKTIRTGCLGLKLTTDVCWSAAVALVAQACAGGTIGLAAFLASFSLLYVLWEMPVQRTILSFARAVELERGVPESDVNDAVFVGAADTCRTRAISGIGAGSDAIGFLHLSDADCVLHLHDRDIVIPRQQMLSLTRVRPKRDTLGWIGTRVIGLTWAGADDPEPRKLYLIAWDGESAFAVKPPAG